jgi:hypothetical protein
MLAVAWISRFTTTLGSIVFHPLQCHPEHSEGSAVAFEIFYGAFRVGHDTSRTCSPAVFKTKKMSSLLNTNVSKVRLAPAELICEPKLHTFAEGDFEGALLSATQHMAIVYHVGIEFGMP